MKNTRETAFFVIYQVLEQGKYSHLVLGEVLKEESDMEKRDRAFITRLVHGTLERLITIDYRLNQLSKTPVKKMKPIIRTILRMSMYQLLYMDSVPDSAVCNEAVKLTKAKGFQGLSGFVNGVLRNAARNKNKWQQEMDTLKQPLSEVELSVRYSLPEWLCRYFIKEYGNETAEQIAKGCLRNPKTTIRCNRAKITKEALAERLSAQGFTVENGWYAEDALYLSDYDTLEKIPEFTEGLFQIQDESSMLVAQLAGLKKADVVLDVCSAPGGKALHAVNLLETLGGGTVISRDITEKKTALILENAKRLQIPYVINETDSSKSTGQEMTENVKDKSKTIFYIQTADATVLEERWIGKADVVIADLPCSGIGIMAKKPEIRYRMTPNQQKELVKLQKEILSVVSQYVKSGGILMYSTCTINREENEENVKELCERYGFSPALEKELVPKALQKDIKEQGWIQFLPGVHACDGFFLARLKK